MANVSATGDQFPTGLRHIVAITGETTLFDIYASCSPKSQKSFPEAVTNLDRDLPSLYLDLPAPTFFAGVLLDEGFYQISNQEEQAQ